MSIGGRQIQEFVTALWRSVETSACPETLNVIRQFREHLTNTNQEPDPNRAEEIAHEQKRAICMEIEKRCADWESSGLPRPLSAILDSETTFITWRHPDFENQTGLRPLPGRFAEVSEWVRSLSSQEFLLPCVLVLKSLGASRIFITDGPGDEGVDIIARVGQGAMQSTALFCQVKTHGDHIGRDMMLAEYAKFLALPHTPKYGSYRAALELDSSVDGSSYAYVFMTNQGFARPAREIARCLGILLRSRIQIVNWLVESYPTASLLALQGRLSGALTADLQLNVADLIAS